MNAVHDGKLRFLGRHEGAHLRHDQEECRLAEIGGLPAHIRAGENDQMMIPVELDIVGYEGLP